jgi:hypothetical protein
MSTKPRKTRAPPANWESNNVDRLLKAAEKYKFSGKGKKWGDIAREVPGFTPPQCKSKYNGLTHLIRGKIGLKLINRKEKRECKAENQKTTSICWC